MWSANGGPKDTRYKMLAQDTNAKGGCHQGQQRPLRTCKKLWLRSIIENRIYACTEAWRLTPDAVNYDIVVASPGRHKYSIQVDCNRRRNIDSVCLPLFLSLSLSQARKGEQLELLSSQPWSSPDLPTHSRTVLPAEISSSRNLSVISMSDRCHFNRTYLDCKSETSSRTLHHCTSILLSTIG